jgi:hypothetical protein
MVTLALCALRTYLCTPKIRKGLKLDGFQEYRLKNHIYQPGGR